MTTARTRRARRSGFGSTHAPWPRRRLRTLHAEEARRSAKSRQLVHEQDDRLGRRQTTGFYLSSFRCVSAFVAKEVVSYAGPYPYIDGLLLQVTQRIGSIEVQHLPGRPGTAPIPSAA